MIPWPEYLFWSVGAASFIVALAAPAIHVASRLARIERRIAELQVDVEWLKRSVLNRGK